MNKYLTEFIGTFFLVLTIGCTVIPGSAGVLPPLAIALFLPETANLELEVVSPER